MSNNSDSGFFAMIDRLWRAFTAMYWVFMFFFVPIYIARHVGRAYSRKRAAKSKCEKKFWTCRIRQDWCLLYIAVCLYYHMFQDFLSLFVSLEMQAKITWCFEFATGIPGFIWYFFTDRQVVEGGNATDFAIATLIGVIGLLLLELAKDYLNLYGHLSVAGNWVPPPRVIERENEKFDQEEAQYRALAKQRQEHEERDPRSHPGWINLSEAQRQKLIARREAEMAVLRKKIEECPRASYFDQPR